MVCGMHLSQFDSHFAGPRTFEPGPGGKLLGLGVDLPTLRWSPVVRQGGEGVCEKEQTKTILSSGLGTRATARTCRLRPRIR